MRKKSFKFVSVLLIAIILLLSSATAMVAKTTDKSNINYAQLLKAQDINYFVEKGNQFINEHPKASMKEINNFIRKEMEKKYLSESNQSTTDEVTPQGGTVYGVELNDQEMDLYNSNPWNGLLSLYCGMVALDESEARYEQVVLHNGNGDAFRHSYWNSLMTMNIGADWARTWSDAHEYGNPTNPPLEQEMDLFNNDVGIYQAQTNFNQYNSHLWADMIEERVDVGGMKRIVDNELVNTDSSGKI